MVKYYYFSWMVTYCGIIGILFVLFVYFFGFSNMPFLILLPDYLMLFLSGHNELVNAAASPSMCKLWLLHLHPHFCYHTLPCLFCFGLILILNIWTSFLDFHLVYFPIEPSVGNKTLKLKAWTYQKEIVYFFHCLSIWGGK